MAAISFSVTLLFHIILSFHHHIASANPREALEIIIGGGGYASPPATSPPYYQYQDSPPPPEPLCPPPPSPPPPPPPACPFESVRVKLAYPIIQKFKKAITHDPCRITDTWNGPDICNKYVGFFCDIVPGTTDKGVAGVDFNQRNLYGKDLTLDGFLDELPDIAIFHANSNNFTGTIPQKIASLPYFYEFDLSNNNLIGQFPIEVLSSTKLTFLDLRFNSFSGAVPPEIFKLDLDVLFLNNNNLAQTLPENLGLTPVLFLTLANNKFTGPIPRSIGRASKTLIEVLFLNNQLTGCLPYEIGFLAKVTVFDVGRNQLTGPIPHSFACLMKMEFLNLAQNLFYGPVPEMVCQLPQLVNFSLSYNYFTQVGPMCRDLIKKKKLDVKMNCILDLPMQRSAADCAAFFSKPKYCPEIQLYKLIPCRKNGRLDSSPERKLTDTDTPPRSYGALTAH